MNKIPTLVLCLVLPATAAAAHEDEPMRIGPEGQIEGFAKVYGPMRLILDLEPLQQCAARPAVVAIEVADGRRLELPPCLVSVFAGLSPQHVRASGSWYHDYAVLPPYLSFSFHRDGSTDGSIFEGLHLLVDAGTGALLRLQTRRLVPCETDHPLFGNMPFVRCGESVDVDMQTHCTEAELAPLIEARDHGMCEGDPAPVAPRDGASDWARWWAS